MDLLDNNDSFPPNVTLSPMNNSYPSQTNSMMMYPQQPQTHIQHHRPANVLYRQPSQQSMYNNYVQQSPNQVPPNYYSMPPPAQQQRISSANHPSSQLTKRQTSLQQQQRSSTPINQQQQPLQLHMSMNVTLPHVKMKYI
jgi:hypothetical protein